MQAGELERAGGRGAWEEKCNSVRGKPSPAEASQDRSQGGVCKQRGGNFVQNCSPGRGERQAGVQRSVQEAGVGWGGGALCVLGRGKAGRERRGLEKRGKGLLEGWQVVESEGTPFPCGLGNDPRPTHPVRLGAGPLWLCQSPPPQNRPFPPPPPPPSPSDFFHAHPLGSQPHTQSPLAAPSCEVQMSGWNRATW